MLAEQIGVAERAHKDVGASTRVCALLLHALRARGRLALVRITLCLSLRAMWAKATGQWVNLLFMSCSFNTPPHHARATHTSIYLAGASLMSSVKIFVLIFEEHVCTLNYVIAYSRPARTFHARIPARCCPSVLPLDVHGVCCASLSIILSLVTRVRR